MRVETRVLRVPEESRDHLDRWGRPGRGVVLELMELGGCLEKLELRVIEDLMVCPVSQERKATGARWDPQDPKVLLVRMDREARMERSGRGDWLERVAQEVCLVQEALQDLLDSLVWLELTVLKDLKETWVLKENRVHLASRASQEHRGCPDRKAPSDHQAKKALRVDQGCLDCLVLMDLLVILAKRVLLERKELWVSRAPRGRSGTRGHAV